MRGLPAAPGGPGRQSAAAEVGAPPAADGTRDRGRITATRAAAGHLAGPGQTGAGASPLAARRRGAAGAPQRRAVPASAGSHLGMPIRVPQASLAPQLRAPTGGTPGPGGGGEAPDVDARPPEATRNMLTLMQQGWQRGRVDDLDDPEGAPGNGTDR